MGCPGATIDHKSGRMINNKPLVLVKEHLWTNFTSLGLPAPTFINVIRDPVEKFTSELVLFGENIVFFTNHSPLINHIPLNTIDADSATVVVQIPEAQTANT